MNTQNQLTEKMVVEALETLEEFLPIENDVSTAWKKMAMEKALQEDTVTGALETLEEYLPIKDNVSKVWKKMAMEKAMESAA